MTTNTRRSFWGRARWGCGTATLLTACATAALAVAGAIAAFALTLREGDARWALLVFALLSVPTVFAAAWVFLVDSSTVSGGVDRPEETVESQWMTRAQSGAFSDLLLVLGLVLVAQLFVGLGVSARTLLVLVVAFAMTDAAVRFAWLTHREG